MCRQLRIALVSAALFAVASTSSAVPLLYNVVPSESNISSAANLTAGVDVTPDLLDEFPQTTNMAGVSNTRPSFASTAIADVGLPGNFDGGANGIEFSQLSIIYDQVLQLFSIGAITVPTGGGTQPAAFSARVGSLSIVLDDPFSSVLAPSGNPNEFLWAGAANVTVSGVLTPTVIVPTVETVELDPVPFSQATTATLAGTFSGDAFGSEVTVGIPVDEIQDLAIPLPPISETIDPGGLGLVILDFDFSSLVFTDLSGSVVYQNSTPIPEPGTAGLLVLGLVGLALRARDPR